MEEISMNIQDDVQIIVQVNKTLKKSFESILVRLGLNMDTAFNMFLYNAVNEDAIPFSLNTKYSGFGNGLTANYITDAFNDAVQNNVNINQQKGFPIARYDVSKKQAYLEMADGSREYING